MRVEKKYEQVKKGNVILKKRWRRSGLYERVIITGAEFNTGGACRHCEIGDAKIYLVKFLEKLTQPMSATTKKKEQDNVKETTLEEFE